MPALVRTTLILTFLTLVTLTKNTSASPITNQLSARPQRVAARAPQTSMSNAERLARGLKPKRPEALYDPVKRGVLLPRASPNAATLGPEVNNDYMEFVQCTNTYAFVDQDFGTITATDTPSAEAQCAALADPNYYSFGLIQTGANTYGCGVGTNNPTPGTFSNDPCTGDNYSLYISSDLQ